jgi:apolipoprotein D and lipocalin family protein
MKIKSIIMAIVMIFSTNMIMAYEDLTTVSFVDLSRYMGRWYEIARLPQSFQKDCTAVTADYRLLENGRVEVINKCRKKTVDGREVTAKGKARVVDKVTNSKLEVSFFWPFWGDYWIFELGQNYEYAVVGSPDKESLWVLSRTSKMDEQLLKDLLDKKQRQGFDVTKMIKTLH